MKLTWGQILLEKPVINLLKDATVVIYSSRVVLLAILQSVELYITIVNCLLYRPQLGKLAQPCFKLTSFIQSNSQNGLDVQSE